MKKIPLLITIAIPLSTVYVFRQKKEVGGELSLGARFGGTIGATLKKLMVTTSQPLNSLLSSKTLTTLIRIWKVSRLPHYTRNWPHCRAVHSSLLFSAEV